jgi:hypothetical protein
VRVNELIRRDGVTVPILDALYRDPSDYVRRSVANHLNDLSRDHPKAHRSPTASIGDPRRGVGHTALCAGKYCRPRQVIVSRWTISDQPGSGTE